MISKHPDGKYNPEWRDLVAKGRARKRAARPKRDILAVKTALATLKLNYCQEISFWNPRHKGRQGDWDGGLQWVDFVVKAKGKRAFVIILDDPSKRWKSYEKIAHQDKQDGLVDRGMSPLLLKKGMSSQEYQVQIAWHLRKVGSSRV
jgi:hypothetical protein